MIIFPEHILDDKYKGEYTKKTYLTLNTPRKWTDKEIEHSLYLKNMGFNYEYIAKCLDRDVTSVAIKLKRVTKKNNTYNKKHRDEKYILNQKFIDIIKPNTVLDLYAANSWYIDKVNNLTTNDIDTKFKTTYNLKADKLLAKLYFENQNFDLIDLDSYGSSYECFELAFRMAKKGIVITFGEFGHIRWKRTDFVSKKYNINTIEDFTFENVNKNMLQKARQNNCKLELILRGNFKNIIRAYYLVK